VDLTSFGVEGLGVDFGASAKFSSYIFLSSHIHSPLSGRVFYLDRYRFGYRSNHYNRSGPVTVLDGYQLLNLKSIKFEFKKLKNERKIE
jgi:hypothetical protein